MNKKIMLCKNYYNNNNKNKETFRKQACLRKQKTFYPANDSYIKKLDSYFIKT